MALPTLPHPHVLVTLGVDTHADSHVAAALDQAGRPLGTRTISTTPGGYAALLGWARRLGTVDRIGVEGTGSYGAGLTSAVRCCGVSGQRSPTVRTCSDARPRGPAT